MKLPIPSVLYLASAALLGFGGWTVYQMLPLWKESVRKAATDRGQADALDLLTKGRGQSDAVLDWVYTRATADWWASFKDANLIGKLPPPPPEPDGPKEPVEEPPKPVRPLEEIFELVAVVHDTETGTGGNSHVIIRYKPEANVQPPEWYVRENMAPTAAATTPGPRDLAPNRPAANPAGPAARPPAPRPTTPMPVSNVGREILQYAWVSGGDDPRRGSRLWPPFEDIRLVRVAADAKSAFFVRTPPPPKPGEPAKEPQEEELLQTTLGVSQDVLRELRRLEGRAADTPRPVAPAAGATPKWVDVQETTRVGAVVNIGRKDEQRFRDNSEEFLTQLNLDTYVSKSSSLKGLQVRNVDPQLATRFGVQQGDVLIELNGRAVQTKAQAMQMGKADYERGVRTFQTKWWSNGQVVERTYQAPDR